MTWWGGSEISYAEARELESLGEPATASRAGMRGFVGFVFVLGHKFLQASSISFCEHTPTKFN